MTFGELAALGVSSGLVASIINLGIAELRTAKRDKRDTKHQVLQVAEHLESYAFTCATYAFDNWKVLVEGRSGVLVSRPPDFPPFADTIAWQAVSADQASNARALATEARSAVTAVDAGFQKGAADGFRTAQFWTLKLGVKAFDLASYLRAHAELPAREFEEPTWDYPTFLRGELEKHRERTVLITAWTKQNMIAG